MKKETIQFISAITLSAFVVFLYVSCSPGLKLFERNTVDNGKIVGKKGLFSGKDYIYIEKKVKAKQQYYIFYDCECGIANTLELRKGVIAKDGTRDLWVGVTDTTSRPSFFNHVIDEKRLLMPIEFMPITEEDINLLNESVTLVNKECCKPTDKAISKIIGYVRIRLN